MNTIEAMRRRALRELTESELYRSVAAHYDELARRSRYLGNVRDSLELASAADRVRALARKVEGL